MREKLIDVHSALMGLIQRAPYIRCADTDRQYAVNWLMNNGVTVQQWIPVTEMLPKPYVDVITLRRDLLSEKYLSVGVEYIAIHGIEEIPTWSKDHLTWKNKVTHWMPLPEPPKEG